MAKFTFPKLRSYRKILLLPVTAFVLAAGSYYSYLAATDNFHAVIPGEVYRSSQPSAKSIANFEQEYGIKTILNLRGVSDDKAWYAAEVAQAKALNITHIDFGISAAKELTPEKAQALIEIMRNAPKPILIHCRSGADRTGLAAALYLAAIAKTNEQTAEGQMSIFYGHISLPISRAFAMDRTFEKMEPLFGFAES
ncbi:protein tyrosine phosphatase [Rhizobium grahamii]|uniref:Protein tyrosine phosphatase n=1 Tax=Rhizobium grahamii TaxID=1120045 RepID=A0A5Q0C7M6_9HYPH|nr:MULTISPECIES: tyrosine-protein phosphatase [Rhizobium]QFY59967.1 protein tyrosine phosphatase [Rhizobium grahamii]QRM50914.1 protein tyrosine phosphatase [Rhizobium sp. BG6]